jgi:TonB family protein
VATAALLLAITIPVARQQFQRPVERVVLMAPRPSPPSYFTPPKVVVRNTPPPVVKPIEPKPQTIAVAPVMPVIKNTEPVASPLAELKPELPPPVELAKKVPPAPQGSVRGFGDPTGVPPAAQSNPAPVMLAKVGSFDLPNGSGQSGGSSHNQSGVVRESGFGTVGAAGAHNTDDAAVRTGAFADSTASPAQRGKTPEVITPVVTPVEILFKPKPAYSAEARTLRLEGQVSLQVVFLSTGSIRVVRVVHGLGHGLDEAAQQAALQVRFKPATRSGVAVDTNATINITFELT